MRTTIKPLAVCLAITLCASLVGCNETKSKQASNETVLDCEGDEEYGVFRSYVVKDGSVFHKFESTEDGRGLRVSQLENCTVIDADNWTCGGGLSCNTNIRECFKDAKETLVNGVYEHIPSSFYKLSETPNSTPRICATHKKWNPNL